MPLVLFYGRKVFVDGNAFPRAFREYSLLYPALRFMVSKIEAKSVFEAYGGHGLSSIVYQQVLRPTRHMVCELDRGRYEALKRNLSGYNVEVKNANSHEVIKTSTESFDLIDFDFENTKVAFQEKVESFRFFR